MNILTYLALQLADLLNAEQTAVTSFSHSGCSTSNETKKGGGGTQELPEPLSCEFITQQL